MTKADLVAIMAERCDIPRTQAHECIKVIMSSIVETLKRGEKVELRGFGSFRVRERGPRVGRNPKTGESVQVPAKRIPYFKPGKSIRETLLNFENQVAQE